jgi:hypothetical protein
MQRSQLDPAPADSCAHSVTLTGARNTALFSLLSYFSEELEADVKSECGLLGAVEKVRMFKHNPKVRLAQKTIAEASSPQSLARGPSFPSYSFATVPVRMCTEVLSMSFSLSFPLQGVVTVRFKTIEAAQKCVDLMNGRRVGRGGERGLPAGQTATDLAQCVAAVWRCWIALRMGAAAAARVVSARSRRR